MSSTTALSSSTVAAPASTVPYLGLAAAADYTQLSERYLRKLVAERGIRHFKAGKLLKFAPADLDAFLMADVREPVVR